MFHGQGRRKYLFFLAMFIVMVIFKLSLKVCGDYSVDTKDINLEILHFKQFYKRFVFDKDEEEYLKEDRR